MELSDFDDEEAEQIVRATVVEEDEFEAILALLREHRPAVYKHLYEISKNAQET